MLQVKKSGRGKVRISLKLVEAISDFAPLLLGHYFKVTSK